MKKQNFYTLLLLSLLISWQQDSHASEKPAVCTITLNQLAVGLCDDNGTVTDPSDDTTSAMFNVTAVDGSASGYTVDGNVISFLALDACNPTCSESYSISAPGPCSDFCVYSVMLETQNSDVYIDNFCYGVIMKAPNGNCYRYKAGNDGTLESELVPCPE